MLSYSAQQYVLRPAEQRLFEKTLQQGGDEKRTLTYLGEGGTGKSWLFNWCWHLLQGARRTIHARLAIEANEDPLERLASLRASAQIELLPQARLAGYTAFPRFDAALILYAATQGGVATLRSKLQTALRSPEQRWMVQCIDEIVAHGGLFDTASSANGKLATSFMRMVGKALERFYGPDKQYGPDVMREIQDFANHPPDELLRLLPRLLARDFNMHSSQDPRIDLVVLIDGYERQFGSDGSAAFGERTDWLIQFQRTLKRGLVVLFSQLRIHWLSTHSAPPELEPAGVRNSKEKLVGRFDSLYKGMRAAPAAEMKPATQEQVTYCPIGLFDEEQVRDYLIKAGIDPTSQAFTEICATTRHPDELALKTRDALENPDGSAASRDGYSFEKALRRVLTHHTEDIRLIKLLRLAPEFSRETVEALVRVADLKLGPQAIEKFLNSAFIEYNSAKQHAPYAIEQHYCRWFLWPVATIAHDYNLPSLASPDESDQREISHDLAKLAAAAAELIKAARIATPALEADARIGQYVEVATETYLGGFFPGDAANWDMTVVGYLYEEALRCVDRHQQNGLFDQALNLATTISERCLHSLEIAASPDVRALLVRIGVRSVEHLLRLHATPWRHADAEQFVNLVETWRAQLDPGDLMAEAPQKRLERYWYCRLICYAHELMPSVRAQNESGNSYFRRIGGSMTAHETALDILRRPETTDGLGMDDDRDHLAFLARALAWSAARRRRDLGKSEALRQEALQILGRLEASGDYRYTREYARVLVDAPDKHRANTPKSEDELRRAIALLENQIKTRGASLDLLELVERARTRLARKLAPHRDDAEHSDPTQRLAAQEKLIESNLDEAIKALGIQPIPPLNVAHYFLRTVRKAVKLTRLKENENITRGLETALRSALQAPFALARSAHYELGRLQGFHVIPPELVIRLLDELAPAQRDAEEVARLSIHRAFAASRIGHAEDTTTHVRPLDDIAEAFAAMARHAETDPWRIDPIYISDRIHLHRARFRLLLADPLLDLQKSALAVESARYLDEYAPTHDCTERTQKLIALAKAEPTAIATEVRVYLATQAAETLDEAALDYRQPYADALETLRALDQNLSEETGARIDRTVERIRRLTQEGTLAGSRLAAAEEALESDDKMALDRAIHRLFGALTAVEKDPVEDPWRAKVRRNWAGLVWRRLLRVNAETRGERAPDYEPPTELLDTFERGTAETFEEDLLNLLASLPSSAKPAAGEILVADFGRVTRGRVSLGAKVRSQYALMGRHQNRTTLIYREDLLAIKDYQRHIVPLINPDAFTAPLNPQSDAGEAGESTEPTASSVSPPEAAEIPGFDTDLLRKPCRRLVSVLAKRGTGGGTHVTARGIEHVLGGLGLFAPLAFAGDNVRERAVMGGSQSICCALVAPAFMRESIRGNGWATEAIKSILGLRHLRLVPASLRPGQAGIEEEIKNFLEKLYSKMQLVSLSSNAALLSAPEELMSIEATITTFKSIFRKMFPEHEPRFLDEQISEPQAAVFETRLGASDLKSDLKESATQLHPPGIAEVMDVAIDKDGVRFVVVNTLGSEETFVIPRGLAKQSGLYFRKGQLLLCEYRWDGKRHIVSAITRKSVPPEQLVMLEIVSIDSSRGMATVDIESKDAVMSALLPLRLFGELRRPEPKVGEVVRGVVRSDLPDGPEVIALDSVRESSHENETDLVTYEARVARFDDASGFGTLRLQGKPVELVFRRRDLGSGLTNVYSGDSLRVDVIEHGPDIRLHRIRWVDRPSRMHARGVVVKLGKPLLLRLQNPERDVLMPPRMLRDHRVETLCEGMKVNVNAQTDRRGAWVVNALHSMDLEEHGRWVSGRLEVRGRFAYAVLHLSDRTVFLPPPVVNALLAECGVLDLSACNGMAVEIRYAEAARGSAAVAARLPPWKDEVAVGGRVRNLDTRRGLAWVALSRDPPEAEDQGNPEALLDFATAAVADVPLAAGVRLRCLLRQGTYSPIVAAVRLDPAHNLIGCLMTVEPGTQGERNVLLRAQTGNLHASARADMADAREYARPIGRHLRVDAFRHEEGYRALRLRPAAATDLHFGYGFIDTLNSEGVVVSQLGTELRQFIPHSVLRLLNAASLHRGQSVRFTKIERGNRAYIGELEIESPSTPWLHNAIVQWFDPAKRRGYAVLTGYDDCSIKLHGLDGTHLDTAPQARNQAVALHLRYHSQHGLSADAAFPIDLARLAWHKAHISFIAPDAQYGFASLNVPDAAGLDDVYLTPKCIAAAAQTPKAGDTIFCKAIPGRDDKRLHAVQVVYAGARLEEESDIAAVVCVAYDVQRGIGNGRTLVDGGLVRLLAPPGNEGTEAWTPGTILLAPLRTQGSLRYVANAGRTIGHDTGLATATARHSSENVAPAPTNSLEPSAMQDRTPAMPAD